MSSETVLAGLGLVTTGVPRRTVRASRGPSTSPVGVRATTARAPRSASVRCGLFNYLSIYLFINLFFSLLTRAGVPRAGWGVMALYQDLPVFRDVYALTGKVFMFTQGFPREYKFTLGQDMKRDCLTLLRSIYRVNKARDKVEHLEGFLDDFELLRLEIRLSTDLKLLSVRQQADLVEVMDKIGKQITGWRNASLKAGVLPVTAGGSEQ